MKKLLTSIVVAIATVIFAEAVEVQNVTAKQRYPWNGLVDITCTVTGISGTTNGLDFVVVAVSQDSNVVRTNLNFWVVRNGKNSIDRAVYTNGNYRLLWDAQADLDARIYSNMVVRVAVAKGHTKVQLWEGGPYWADTNIGAENPREYGYYFWWGDTVGYKHVNGKWVASDGSSQNFSFAPNHTPTYAKSIATLQSEGWVTADDVLVPVHDAAHVHWGNNWRMPTRQELDDLSRKCDWTWTTNNNVKGYIVRGEGTYASACIFLPCASHADGNSISYDVDGSSGFYWSSVPSSSSRTSWSLDFFFEIIKFDMDDEEYSYYYSVNDGHSREIGFPVRPVQGFSE